MNAKRRHIDVFPFFNEVDLLEIRLNTLDSVVDLFVISEFDRSFSGAIKPYYLERDFERFHKFSDKIIYIKQKQEVVYSPFENDHFQKDAIRSHLLGIIEPSDVVTFGDLDEIPNPDKIISARKYLDEGIEFLHFAQRPFYGYLNLEDCSGKLLSYAGEYRHIIRKQWLGTVAVLGATVQRYSMTELRDPSRKSDGKRISNGGWHFSYVGGKNSSANERITDKIANNAHQEFNSPNVLESINSNLSSQTDFLQREYTGRFGKRKVHRFRERVIDGSFPPFIMDNQDKLKHLIYDHN